MGLLGPALCRVPFQLIFIKCTCIVQILAAAAAAAHNRAARAAATSVKPTVSTTESTTHVPPLLPATGKHEPPTPTPCTFQRRLPRRPRESEDKRFRCPFCELAYYHKKHLKYHLTKKHGFWFGSFSSLMTKASIVCCVSLRQLKS